MRLVFCKIHCPTFICFCKPPSPHIYTPPPTPPPTPTPTTTTSPAAAPTLHDHPPPPQHVPPSKSKLESVPETCDENETTEKKIITAEEISLTDGSRNEPNCLLKSSLRKPNSDSTATKQQDEVKKRVQWMDFLGKQLVDIREFECSELDDTDYEDQNTRGCICVIL